MSILSIENLQIDDKCCYVEAIIDDVALIHHQTRFDPPEYGPALCSTSFNTEDVEVPADENEFKKLLEELCPAWRIIDPPYIDDFEVDCVI